WDRGRPPPCPCGSARAPRPCSRVCCRPCLAPPWNRASSKRGAGSRSGEWGPDAVEGSASDFLTPVLARHSVIPLRSIGFPPLDPPPPAARLAKLAVPEPSRVCPRPRLSERIDAARRHGNVLWVAAPAGAGKTTLLASYLRARGLRAAWYRVDAADGDVASFLFHLGQVAGDATDLPAFTAEYLAALPAFARNWFRRFYALVPRLQALVFDDYHEIAADSPVHVALREALFEAPRELTVIVASRLEP